MCHNPIQKATHNRPIYRNNMVACVEYGIGGIAYGTWEASQEKGTVVGD